MLIHPVPDLDAKLQLVTDASSVAVVAVLQQNVNDWQPLGFFSHELKNPEQKYHTFPRKLLAVYLDIKHLHYFLEGCNFHVLTDHKSLTFRFQRNHSDHRACEIRHLCFVLEFTVGLGHVRAAIKALQRTHCLALVLFPRQIQWTGKSWQPLKATILSCNACAPLLNR